MTTRVYRLLFVAALVVIAGCVGAGGLGGEVNDDPGSEDTNERQSNGTASVSGETGALTFYVSDEPNRIDDFEHLNVTVTKIGLKATGSASDGSTDDTENEAEAENATESDAVAENETDSVKGDWREYEIDEQTVDLTELQGANASALDVLDVPEGEYETVFIYVSETEGILTDGTETRVKLPSEKLKIQTPFTVTAGEEIDFVFDIAPHEAGNSGKYILKPVISQSGTGEDREIRDVDDPANDNAGAETDDTEPNGENGNEGDGTRTDGPEAESNGNASDENDSDQARLAALETVN